MTRIERDTPWGDPANDIACAPSYSRLPGYNCTYRLSETVEDAEQRENGDVAWWLTAPFDELLCELKIEVEGFYDNHLNPLTARPSSLDWLALHLGFTGEYWDGAWPVAVKRALLSIADDLWAGYGTFPTLNAVLGALDVQTCTNVWPPNESGHDAFRLPRMRADLALAGDSFRFSNRDAWIRMPDGVARTSELWQRAEWATELFSPGKANVTVCHCTFRADESVAGDGLFDYHWERSRPLAEQFYQSEHATDDTATDDEIVTAFAKLLAFVIDAENIPARVVQVQPFRADTSAADDRFWESIAANHPAPESALGSIGEFEPAPTVFVIFEPSATWHDEDWQFARSLYEHYAPYSYFDPDFAIGHGLFYADISPATAPLLADTPGELEALPFVAPPVL